MSRDRDLPHAPRPPQVPGRRLLLKGAAPAGVLTAASAVPGAAHAAAPAAPAAPPRTVRYPNPLVQQRADPHIHRHADGVYYFTATAPEYDRIVLRRSRTLNGPSTAAESVAEDGRSDVLVYHARRYKEIVGDPLNDPDRHTRVQKLDRNADGTPAFGIPVAGATTGTTSDMTAGTTAATVKEGA